MTLNPLAHLDFLGTLFLFLFHFGWAKPVPVNPYNFRDPKRDMIYVALAGPGSNLVLALIFGIVLRVLIPHVDPATFSSFPARAFLVAFLILSLQINLALAFFNLLPIPPLDGSRIVEGLARGRTALQLQQFFRYGAIVLVLLVLVDVMGIFPVFGLLLWKPVSLFSHLFSGTSTRILNYYLWKALALAAGTY